MAKTKGEEPINDFDHTQVLGKKPDKVYRWVRRDSIAFRKAKVKGYETVSAEEVKSGNLEAPFMDVKPADGTIGDGSLVLMAADRKGVEERQAKQVARNASALKAHKERYVEEMARSGMMTREQVKEFERTGIIERTG